VVRGAALLFRQLEFVSLRRATHLTDGALTCLAISCGAHLKVYHASSPPLDHVATIHLLAHAA
jgi:hypothetical protein